MKSFVLKFVYTFALLTFFALPTFALQDSNLPPCSLDKTTSNALQNAVPQKDGNEASQGDSGVVWSNTSSI